MATRVVEEWTELVGLLFSSVFSHFSKLQKLLEVIHQKLSFTFMTFNLIHDIDLAGLFHNLLRCEATRRLKGWKLEKI